VQKLTARAKPRPLNYGSAGIGTIPHLAGELFAHAAGIKLTPVHYRGAGPALNDLLAGQVQAIFVGLGVVHSQPALKRLAVSQSKRLAAAPADTTAAGARRPPYTGQNS